MRVNPQNDTGLLVRLLVVGHAPLQPAVSQSGLSAAKKKVKIGRVTGERRVAK
jgi:hypothetical protein